MVNTETLAWLAKSGHQSERFVQRIGRRCREASISSVAKEFGPHWEPVRNLDIQYMQRQSALCLPPLRFESNLPQVHRNVAGGLDRVVSSVIPILAARFDDHP